MRVSRRTVFMATVLLAPVSQARAQTAVDPSGHWQGAITTPFREVDVEIDVARRANGELMATYSQPSINLRGFPLAHVALDDTGISFELTANGGGTFHGTLLAGGTSLSGEFAAAFGRAPFTLIRTGEAHIDAPPRNGAIAPALEGTWNATLAIPGQHLRLVLRLSNQPDGTAAGTIISPDQGGIEFPLGVTQKAAALTLNAVAIGGDFFVGAVNASGTELSGTFTEDAFTVPLTFTRAAARETGK